MPYHQSPKHEVKFTSVLRFYSDMAEADDGLGTARISIDIGNEGNYFLEHSRDWLNRFLEFEYAKFDSKQEKKALMQINP